MAPIVKENHQVIDLLHSIDRRIRRLESILINDRIESDLTEEDVLKMVGEGNQEYREGKTEQLESFLRREYPHLIHKKPRRHRAIQKVVSETPA